ncbi:MAG: hypothetical protein WBB57_17485, partial [Mycobacterium sp.]
GAAWSGDTDTAAAPVTVTAAVEPQSLPPYIDQELAAEAARLCLPFVYQLHHGGVSCHPRLRLPDGSDYALDGALAADTGKLLDSGARLGGDDAGHLRRPVRRRPERGGRCGGHAVGEMCPKCAMGTDSSTLKPR